MIILLYSQKMNYKIHSYCNSFMANTGMKYLFLIPVRSNHAGKALPAKATYRGSSLIPSCSGSASISLIEYSRYTALPFFIIRILYSFGL